MIRISCSATPPPPAGTPKKKGKEEKKKTHEHLPRRRHLQQNEVLQNSLWWQSIEVLCERFLGLEGDSVHQIASFALPLLRTTEYFFVMANRSLEY